MLKLACYRFAFWVLRCGEPLVYDKGGGFVEFFGSILYMGDCEIKKCEKKGQKLGTIGTIAERTIEICRGGNKEFWSVPYMTRGVQSTTITSLSLLPPF